MDTPSPRPLPPPSKRKTRSIFAILAAVVLALAFWQFYPSANNHLAARNIPRLPMSAKVENLREGGFFADWLFLRASLSPEAFETYAGKFSVPRETIGRGKGQVLIVHSKDANALFDHQDLPLARIQVQEQLDGIEVWWTTHEIDDGFLFSWTDGVDGWRVYFDTQRHLVFIYWHHS